MLVMDFHNCWQPTSELSLAGSLGEQLDKVGEILSKETRTDDEVFSSVVCEELSAEEFGLTAYPQG